jgi:hypothetical protein
MTGGPSVTIPTGLSHDPPINLKKFYNLLRLSKKSNTSQYAIEHGNIGNFYRARFYKTNV